MWEGNFRREEWFIVYFTNWLWGRHNALLGSFTKIIVYVLHDRGVLYKGISQSVCIFEVFSRGATPYSSYLLLVVPPRICMLS